MRAWIMCRTYKCPRSSTFTFAVIPILDFIFYYMFFTLRVICKRKWLTNQTTLCLPYWHTEHKNGLSNQSINKYSYIKNVHASVHVGTYCVVILTFLLKITQTCFLVPMPCCEVLHTNNCVLRQWPVPLASGNHAT